MSSMALSEQNPMEPETLYRKLGTAGTHTKCRCCATAQYILSQAQKRCCQAWGSAGATLLTVSRHTSYLSISKTQMERLEFQKRKSMTSLGSNPQLYGTIPSRATAKLRRGATSTLGSPRRSLSTIWSDVTA